MSSRGFMRSPSLLQEHDLNTVFRSYPIGLTEGDRGDESTQLHCSCSEELASSLLCSLSSTTLRPREAKLFWEDSVHEISGLCPPTGLEGPGESSLKAFLESTRLLLSSLDICREGTTCVSVCLLTSNGQSKCMSPKSGLSGRSTYDHLRTHPKN